MNLFEADDTEPLNSREHTSNAISITFKNNLVFNQS